MQMHDRGYSTHAVVPTGHCLKHGQWRTPSVSSQCTDPHWSSSGLRCFPCAIHDPWKCVHENIKTNETTKVRVLCVLELFKFCMLNYLVASVILACSYTRIFEQCAYSPDVYSWLIVPALHQMYALIPNSWYRSFCRTRFQKGWDTVSELDNTEFPWKLSGVRGHF